MLKKILSAGVVLAAVSAAPAFAASSFQYTCSNTSFAYVSNQAALQATCLRANGSSNPTTLILNGISNQNGNLVQGSGSSSFQQSCGNIQVSVNGGNVTLSALCRTTGGNSVATSLPLNNISNQNGNLSY